MKAHQIKNGGASAIVMDLGDVELEAKRIIIRARKEAEQILQQAKAHAEAEALSIREQARQAGHAEGLALGLDEGRKSGHAEALAQTQPALADLVARWSQTLEILHSNMAVHHADAKADLVRLALAVAERVTHQEALRNRKVAEATITEALRTIGKSRNVAIHVSPVEIDVLENYLPYLLTSLRSIESVELTPDETVTPGGCTVRFGGGELDGRLETQIQRIADELLAGE